MPAVHLTMLNLKCFKVQRDCIIILAKRIRIKLIEHMLKILAYCLDSNNSYRKND